MLVRIIKILRLLIVMAGHTTGGLPESARLVGGRRRRAPRPPHVCAMLVVVLLELAELSLEITRGPEQHPSQTFAPHGSDQSFGNRMGARVLFHKSADPLRASDDISSSS